VSSVKKKASLKLLLLLFLTVLLGVFHFFLTGINSIVANDGVSFGINGRLVIILSILFVIFLIIFYFKSINNWFLVSILAGGILNLIDRLFFGYVRDYWYFFGIYNNLADWSIAIGVLLSIMEIYAKRDKNNLRR